MKKLFTLLAASLLTMSASATVLWEGEVVMGDWAKMMEYKNIPENTQWNNAAMSALKVGDKLVFTYKDVDTSDPEKPAQIQLATFAGESWTWTELVSYDNIEGTSYTYTVTGDPFGDYTDLEMLSATGFAVKGQRATLVKVELNPDGTTPDNPDTPDTPDTPGTATALWEGEVVMGSWANMMEYKNVEENTQWNNAAMSALKAGDKLVFTYKDVDSSDPEKPAQIQLATFAGEAWTWTVLVEYADIAGTSYTYTVTGDPFGDYTDVEMLSATGFAVKGQKATLVKVELVTAGTPGQDGIENVAIDMNAPVEIYNLQGVRVNEMVNGQIYILRQGNTVTKVIK